MLPQTFALVCHEICPMRRGGTHRQTLSQMLSHKHTVHTSLHNTQAHTHTITHTVAPGGHSDNFGSQTHTRAPRSVCPTGTERRRGRGGRESERERAREREINGWMDGKRRERDRESETEQRQMKDNYLCLRTRLPTNDPLMTQSPDACK